MFAVVNSKGMKNKLCKCVVKLNINHVETSSGCSSKRDDTGYGGAVAPGGQAVNDLQNGSDEVHTIGLIAEPVYPIVNPINFPLPRWMMLSLKELSVVSANNPPRPC